MIASFVSTVRYELIGRGDMIQIRVLGNLEIVGPNGLPLADLLVHPKRTALLVYLTLNSRVGLLRRDSLLGVFWPDHGESRARGSLRTHLHALRQDIGTDAIVTRGDEEVGVNHELIGCDVLAFEGAVVEGHLERAAELFRGPFLSGFYLKGQADFEQWVDGVRDRLSRKHVRVLEDLADQAALDGDMPRVVEWCRMLALHNPYSTRVVLRYMKALEAVGDRAAALAFADRHARRMQSDLEAAPSPDVVTYAERLKDKPRARESRSGERSSQPSNDEDATLTGVRDALSGRYDVQRELGRGGMATVYLAEDTKHHRKVAIKVLRPELAALIGSERFLKEIEVTANLQHPNILPLYDSGEANAFLYYVMPYVDGESLRDRLNRERQLGIEETVGIVKDVAAALQYAHDHDVIHRDIKPENILLQSGQALVADFGIALAITEAGGTRLTETGLSLGTPHYMSPEQAAAERQPDGRSDIYSLGAVAYEMLIGRPPFDGSSAQMIVGRILSEPVPDMRALRDTVPPHMQVAIETALRKIPADRYTTASEFAFGIAQPRVDTVARHISAATVVPPKNSGWLIGIGAALVVAMALAVAGWLRPPSTPSLQTIKLSLDLPPDVTFTPDCQSLVYRAGGAITIRDLNRLDERRVAPAGWSVRAISPDSKWIAFFQGRSIEKGALDGERIVTVAEDVGSFPQTLGLSWGVDGYIYFSPGGREGIHRVPATGGLPETFTSLDSTGGEINHRFPDAHLDGRTHLYTSWIGNPDSSMIRLFRPGTNATVTIARGTHARFLGRQYVLVGGTNGSISAIRFNEKTLAPIGNPVRIAEDADMNEYGEVAFSACADGLFAYGHQRNDQHIVLVNPDGLAHVVAAGDFANPSLSPDGQSVAVSRWLDGKVDIWLYTLAGIGRRLTTTEGNSYGPVWTPDGASVSFFNDGTGDFDIYRQQQGGASRAEPIVSNTGFQMHHSWSPNGELLAYHQPRPNSPAEREIIVTEMATRESRIVVENGWLPTFSPDGRFLAYSSEGEVWVVDVQEPGSRWQVSDAGGSLARWHPDGRKLYYTTPDNLLMVEVDLTPTFGILTPPSRIMALTESGYRGGTATAFDVGGDGSMLFHQRLEPETELIFLTNIFEELAALGDGNRIDAR